MFLLLGSGALGLWVDLKFSISFLLLTVYGFSAMKLNYNSGKAFNDIVCWAREI